MDFFSRLISWLHLWIIWTTLLNINSSKKESQSHVIWNNFLHKEWEFSMRKMNDFNGVLNSPNIYTTWLIYFMACSFIHHNFFGHLCKPTYNSQISRWCSCRLFSWLNIHQKIIDEHQLKPIFKYLFGSLSNNGQYFLVGNIANKAKIKLDINRFASLCVDKARTFTFIWLCAGPENRFEQ